MNVVSISLGGRFLPFIVLFVFNPPFLPLACPLRELGEVIILMEYQPVPFIKGCLRPVAVPVLFFSLWLWWL